MTRAGAGRRHKELHHRIAADERAERDPRLAPAEPGRTRVRQHADQRIGDNVEQPRRQHGGAHRGQAEADLRRVEARQVYVDGNGGDRQRDGRQTVEKENPGTAAADERGRPSRPFQANLRDIDAAGAEAAFAIGEVVLP